jgi:hypothetical protein
MFSPQPIMANKHSLIRMSEPGARMRGMVCVSCKIPGYIACITMIRSCCWCSIEQLHFVHSSTCTHVARKLPSRPPSHMHARIWLFYQPYYARQSLARQSLARLRLKGIFLAMLPLAATAAPRRQYKRVMESRHRDLYHGLQGL